jgi:hypothetical protein
VNRTWIFFGQNVKKNWKDDNKRRHTYYHLNRNATVNFFGEHLFLSFWLLFFVEKAFWLEAKPAFLFIFRELDEVLHTPFQLQILFLIYNNNLPFCESARSIVCLFWTGVLKWKKMIGLYIDFIFWQLFCFLIQMQYLWLSARERITITLLTVIVY